jgi:hypothetical protein
MSDIVLFSQARRIPILEEEKVGIEDYNSKENRRGLRELREKQEKNEDGKEEDKYPLFEKEDPELLALGTDGQLTGDIQEKRIMIESDMPPMPGDSN